MLPLGSVVKKYHILLSPANLEKRERKEMLTYRSLCSPFGFNCVKMRLFTQQVRFVLTSVQL